MKVLGFNRVEMIVPEGRIDEAVRQFNDVLGTKLPTPIAIDGHPVRSSTDFEGGVELVSTVDGEGPFAGRGLGAVGPLVWEIESVDDARRWLGENGYRIAFEYDSTAGGPKEASTPVRQLVLDPEQWFGFLITLMERDARACES